jgi:hypothetical protein
MDSLLTYAAGFLLHLQRQKSKFYARIFLWKVHILEYDYSFDIQAGLLSFILAIEMIGDGTYILYFSLFQESILYYLDSAL